MDPVTDVAIPGLTVFAMLAVGMELSVQDFRPRDAPAEPASGGDGGPDHPAAAGRLQRHRCRRPSPPSHHRADRDRRLSGGRVLELLHRPGARRDGAVGGPDHHLYPGRGRDPAVDQRAGFLSLHGDCRGGPAAGPPDDRPADPAAGASDARRHGSAPLARIFQRAHPANSPACRAGGDRRPDRLDPLRSRRGRRLRARPRLRDRQPS